MLSGRGLPGWIFHCSKTIDHRQLQTQITSFGTSQNHLKVICVRPHMTFLSGELYILGRFSFQNKQVNKTYYTAQWFQSMHFLNIHSSPDEGPFYMWRGLIKRVVSWILVYAFNTISCGSPVFEKRCRIGREDQNLDCWICLKEKWLSWEPSTFIACFVWECFWEASASTSQLLLFVENEIFAFQAEDINISTQSRHRDYLLFLPLSKPSLNWYIRWLFKVFLR